MITETILLTLFFSTTHPYKSKNHLNAKLICRGKTDATKNCVLEFYREPPSKCGDFSYDIYERRGNKFIIPNIVCRDSKHGVEIDLEKI